MWTKVKNILTANVGLKILAVCFALGLWLLVVNIDDPSQTKTFTATVQVINEQVLTDAGKYYTIDDGKNTVSFRVTAKRSVIERLSNSDFIATADMNYLEDNSRVPIDISVSRLSNSISISAKTQYLQVTIGNRKTQKFVIDAETTGSPAEGCAVGETSVSPNVVTITGPAEIVSTINKVVASCDVTDMSSDIRENVVPILYDSKGKPVDTTGLELSVTTVEVSVTMLTTKTVKINVDTRGTLAAGLQLDRITTSPETIAIKGDGERINEISSITIPSSVVDLSTITEDFNTTVDITSYLPDDVSLVDSTKAQVTVKVSLASKVSKTYNVPTANLTVKNLDSTQKVTFSDSTVAVTITGLESELAKIEEANLTGSIDVSGLTIDAVHPVTITWDLDDALEASTTTTKIKITQH